MASETLFVLDASLHGGLVVGSGSMRYAQTMAFMTLMLFQLFNVSNASRGTKRIQVPLYKSLGVGSHWIVTGVTDGCNLHSVSATSIFDSELEFCRLGPVYDGCKFGAVAARTGQSCNTSGE